MQKLDKTLSQIEKIDYSLAQATQKRLDNLTKPQGSLGRLEEIAKQVVEITRKTSPRLKNKVIFTLAGDHGVTEEKISAFPKEVTAQMVYNFLSGGAGINVLARHTGARVVVADLGVAEKIQKSKFQSQNFKDKKINFGTRNMAVGPAMTKEEARKAVEAGITIFEDEASGNIDIIGVGEMGIGNTTSAAAITSCVTGRPAEETAGRGTGIDTEGYARKVAVIKKALEVNKPDAKDALDVLAKVGGFEIGGIAGIILASAAKRVPVVVDGFISTAGALIACQLEPKIKDYLFAGHSSVEKGHKIILDYIGIKPILNLEMRLGEGTGAALAMNIIEAAVKILAQMATFEGAGVSEK